ncbi:MAG: SDR family oxidoreductase [Solirubrobacterales bacterium]
MADGPVLLITGASSGIGAATARRAVQAGRRVALAARSEDRLSELASELGGEDTALAVRCDVTDWDDVQRAVSETREHFGAIDAVLANAGFGASRGFLEESVEHWRSMVETNVLGVALTIRAALPVMLEQDRGHMLLLGSVAGRRALPGSLYSATKFAVTAMGEGLRQELRSMHDNQTIKVTLIEPGMVDTPFFDNRPEGALEAGDIANAIAFALDQPSHVDVNEILVRPIGQPV